MSAEDAGREKRGDILLRKLLAFTVVLVLAALMLAACGGEEDDEGEDSSAGQKESAKAGKTEKTEPQPIDAVQVAYKNTAKETARVTFNMNMDMPDVPAGPDANGQPAAMQFRMKGRGVVDFPGQESRMVVRMGPMGNFQMRMVDDVAYQKMPQQMRAPLGGGKPWVKMDLDAFYGQQYGMSYSEMQNGASTDPTRQLEYLRGVSGSVEEVGEEKVRGVPTTHYRAVMDLKKAFAEQGLENKKAYDQMVRQMGTSKVPVDVWLDEENRVRRYRMDMEVKAPAGQPGQGGTTTEDMKVKITMIQEYFNFGVKVNVNPPPPEKTMSYKELEQQMQQQQRQQRQQQQQEASAAKS